jgi:hypothetical protein
MAVLWQIIGVFINEINRNKIQPTVAINQEHKLQVYGNKMFRKLFGTKDI